MLTGDCFSMIRYRLPFNEQYRAYEQVRDLMPSHLQKNANLYGMDWYDNIWGMLMMNCVNGGGVTATGEVTSVCLMRAGKDAWMFGGGGGVESFFGWVVGVLIGVIGIVCGGLDFSD